MKHTKTLRENLLIPQEHFAVYLNVSRSLLTMFENGNRALPTAALLKLSALQLSLPKNILPKNVLLAASELQQQQADLQTYLQQQKIFNTQKIKHLQKQLNAVKLNYSNALQLLQAIRTLQQQTPDTAKNKKDILWLAATEAMAIEKIKANGLVAQQKLQKQIDTLS